MMDVGSSAERKDLATSRGIKRDHGGSLMNINMSNIIPSRVAANVQRHVEDLKQLSGNSREEASTNKSERSPGQLQDTPKNRVFLTVTLYYIAS